MLDSNQIRPYQGDMIDLLEHPDHSAVIDARDEGSEEIGQQCGLLLQIECQGFVIAMGNFCKCPKRIVMLLTSRHWQLEQ